MFDLENEINRWKKTLSRSEHVSESDIAELESHLRDEVDHQIEHGLSPEAAFGQALKQSASGDLLGREYGKFRPLDARRPFWHPASFMPALAWNYLKIAGRLLRRQKLYSGITVFGLAVGLACFILFFLSWRFERSFDRFNERAERIYRVEMDWKEFGPVERVAGSYPGLAPDLRRSFPQVKSAARINNFRKPTIQVGDRTFLENRATAADPEIFGVFTLPLVRGEAASFLRRPDEVVLSASTARKFFGEADPVGQKLKISLNWGANRTREFECAVAGILADLPLNATYRFEILLPLEIVNRLLDTPDFLNTWDVGMPPFLTFLLLDGKAPLPDLEKSMTNLVIRRSGLASIQKIVLNPLLALHAGDPNLDKYLRIFGALGLIVLLLACLNTVNLSMARASRRIKEVGVKKIAGASRWILVRQFLVEAVVTAFLSLALAVVLVLAALPLFQAATGRSLPADQLFSLGLWAQLIGLAVLVGLGAGAYPALVLSGIRPVELFRRSRVEKTSRSLFRKSLIFVQFVSLGVLLTGSVVVSRQLGFIRKANLGLDKDNIMAVRIDDNRIRWNPALPAFHDDLSKIPGVVSTGRVFATFPLTDTPVQLQAPWAADPGKSTWQYMTGDAGFLALFGIPLVDGRGFSPGDEGKADGPQEILINETAARRLGGGSPVGKEVREFFHGEDFSLRRIVGVVRDFHSRSLHHPIEPLVISKNKNGSLLCLKLRPDEAGRTIAAVRTLWKRHFPSNPLDFYFLEDDYRTAYASEDRLSLVAGIFSGLSILIAVLGLFGLIAFNTEQRRKEIGIRKILGATFGRMTGVFLREYGAVVVLSNLAVWPLAFMAATSWLRGFAFRTNLPVFVFLLSTAATAGITLLTVGFQVGRASCLNPAEILRQD